MAAVEKKRKQSHEQLKQTLNSHLENTKQSIDVLYQTPPPSSEKVRWEEVVKMGDQVNKQATLVGMLYSGETPEAKALEESMSSYFNLLQGLLWLAHGSKVGAGYTLSSTIVSSITKVVDTSSRLITECIALYGIPSKKVAIPQLVGTVWDSCSALKKTPTTNITAVGRAMTQISICIKDVLREMKELKPASSSNEAATSTNKESDDDCSFVGDDLGDDLSPEEMHVAQSAILVISDSLNVIKELIRIITGWLKLETERNSDTFVKSLEKLLSSCDGIRSQIDHMGACLYPPQEFSALKDALEKVSRHVDEMQLEIETFDSLPEGFLQACNGLKASLRAMESNVDSSHTIDLLNQL